MARQKPKPKQPPPEQQPEQQPPPPSPQDRPQRRAHAGTRSFAALGCLSPATLAVLDALGFDAATPVQEATIPLFCGHKDVAVDACTGSGKTLAFVLPVVERLRRLEERLKRHQVGAVVVSPTRELARQIHDVAAPFVASVPGLSSLLLVGGTDPAADVAAFRERGGHVLIGTPGRIDDVLKRLGAAADTRRVEVLVLDEADRLLDMGFRAQLDAIMARLPRQRRTGLFSATQTEAVEALARAGLRNPVKVAVAVAAAAAANGGGGAGAAGGGGGGANGAAAGKGADDDGDDGDQQQQQQQQAHVPGQRTPSSLRLEYTLVPVEQKLPQLVALLDRHGRAHKVICYFLTCAAVEYYALVLRRLPALRGLRVSALHGRLKQAQREATLAAFAELPAGVLLCTDVAARGLDIPDVAVVLQYDPPQDPAAFVHRVGRTARMGRTGAALALLLPSEATYAEFQRLRRVPLREAPPLQPQPQQPQPQQEETAQQGSSGAGGAAGAAAGAAAAGAAAAGAAAGGAAAGAGELATTTMPPDAAQLAAWLRQQAESDREAMEKATRAFVSLVRGYKEHHCKFVFRIQELPLGPLAVSLGLLRLPRMPELKKGSAANALGAFTASAVEPDSVPFRDKARERQRQAALKQQQAQQLAQQQEGGPQQQQQDKKKHKAGKQGSASAAAAAAAAADEAGPRLTAAKRRHLQARDELAELQHDYAMLRKLKRGKISAHAFDVATGLSSASSDDGGGGSGDGEKEEAEVGGGPSPAAAAAAQQPQQQNGSAGGKRGRGGGGGAAQLAPPARSALAQEAQLRRRKKRRLKKRQAAEVAATAH